MLKKEVKAVLFDLDGTLVDSLNAWFYVYNDALSQFGFPAISKKEFKKHFGSPIEKDVKRDYSGCTIRQVEEAYNRNFLKRISLVRIFPDAKATLESLRKMGCSLALITGSTEPITNSLLKKFNLKKYFDAVLTMKDVRHRKPAPDAIFKACKLMKIQPKNAILIGDSINDVIAGRRAKVTTIGYRTKGDYEIGHLNEIPGILKG